MLEVIAPGELDQAGDRGDGRRVKQMQPLLGAADVRIGVLQHREKESLLVTEVVVKHPLIRARAGGDPVDARAAEPEAGELSRGGLQDAGPRPLRVARHRPARRAAADAPRGHRRSVRAPRRYRCAPRHDQIASRMPRRYPIERAAHAGPSGRYLNGSTATTPP